MGIGMKKKQVENQYKDKVVVEEFNNEFINTTGGKNQVKAYGTFVKKGNNLFRKEAYIQFGNSQNTLGTIIMLNPGRAVLKETKIEDNMEIHGELRIDPTMDSIIKLVNKFYAEEKEIQGRVKLYNLFPLQNARSNDAISMFEKLWNEKEPLVTEFPKTQEILLNELKSSSWVLVGWGCGRSSENLNAIKERWLSLIAQSKTPLLGKEGNTYLKYHHPRPHLQSQQINYRNELKMQYDQVFKKTDHFNYRNIQDESWKRHVDYYNPVEEITIGNYKLLLFDLNEKDQIMNYKYRLICFVENNKVPILTLNHEKSYTEACFFGASHADGNQNLGYAPCDMDIQQFRKWALQNITDYIKELDSKAILKIIDNFKPLVQNNLPLSPLDQLRKKRVENITKKMREFEDRFEYLYVPDYEERYEKFYIHAVPVGNIQLVLLERDEEIELVAIEFYRNQFSLEEAVNWILRHTIYFQDINKTPHFVQWCDSIIDIIRFKSKVIALYSKGGQTLELEHVDELKDLTETYNLRFDKVDVSKSKKLQKGLSIVLNEELIKELPRIDFNKHQDIVVSNGNVVKADYIDVYRGGIGLFRNGEVDPIVYLFDNNTTVTIDLYSADENQQVCIIEHKYLFNIEVD